MLFSFSGDMHDLIIPMIAQKNGHIHPNAQIMRDTSFPAHGAPYFWGTSGFLMACGYTAGTLEDR